MARLVTLPDVSGWADGRGWTPAAGALKVCEEAGEVAATINKAEPMWRLGDELADVVIACCTTAHLAGIDLENVLAARWDEVKGRP